jgi:hypothetical protein
MRLMGLGSIKIYTPDREWLNEWKGALGLYNLSYTGPFSIRLSCKESAFSPKFAYFAYFSCRLTALHSLHKLLLKECL